jgi:hypothetical protein
MTEVVEGEVLTEEQVQEELQPTKKRRVRRDRKIRDKMFVDEYMRNGGNATKAAWAVTGAKTKASAQFMGHQLLQRNKEDIEQRMVKFGLTDELVFKRHKDIIENGGDTVAMKGIDTYYKVTRKEGGSDGNVTIHFNF